MHCNVGHFYAHNKTFCLQLCLWKQQIGRSIMPLNRVNHLPSEWFKRLFIAHWKALTIINTPHTVRCQSEGWRQRRELSSTFVLGRFSELGPVVWTSGIVVCVCVFFKHGLSHSVACGIFPDQGLNLCLLHWQVDCLPLSHQGSLIWYFSTILICLLQPRQCQEDSY